MQRYHLTLWLALVAALWSTQCDSLSDDCKKTLTCGDAGAPVLSPSDCIWRFPDGGVWTDGPQLVGGMWQWPNGEPAPAFECSPLQGQGGSGGASDNCTNSEPPEQGRTKCEPAVCDLTTRNCVECLVSPDCAAKSDVATTGEVVCDTIAKRCVRCVGPRDCTGDTTTPFCFVDTADVTRNACVECLDDPNCTNSEQCDTRTHECSLACSAAVNDCAGDKPFCDTVAGICVECLDDMACSGGTSQCNPMTHQCVQCTNDTPCMAIGRVCNTTTNTCVVCTGDNQCTTGSPETPHCDNASSSCVECLSNDQCLLATESRCNVGSHTCEICTADDQCEMLAPKCRPGDGRCVACLEDVHCPMGLHCDTMTGQCDGCVSDANCITAAAARCDVALASLTFHECVGCNANPQCSNKGLPPLCRVGDGTCVNCLNNSDCTVTGPATSQCGSGTCVACTDDDDCDLFPGLRACRTSTDNPGCVECTGDGDCINDPDGRACKLVDTGVTDGPAAINTCVECIDNSDCTDPEFSRCVQNQCEPCVANGDCANLVSGERVCDRSDGDGVCVECTGQQRAACGAFVCDSVAKECSLTEVAGSAVLCESCISDAHCAANARCIEQNFQGTEVGFFCFPVSPAACARPYVDVLLSTTIDEVAATVCLLRETTCPALNAYGANCAGPAGAPNDPACGVPALPDGTCAQGPLVLQCTIPCQNLNDCPAGGCASNQCSL